MEKIGRPTVMTIETISKLEQAFLQGLSDTEACLYADIGTATLYLYCQDNPDFSERKELLKEKVKMRAKLNVSDAIEKGDRTLSQWYLERRDKAFSSKQEIDHTTKGDKIESSETIKELTQKLNDLYRGTSKSSDGESSSAMGTQTQDKE